MVEMSDGNFTHSLHLK